MSVVSARNRTPADALPVLPTSEQMAINLLYNGATFDLERNDVELTVMASAGRTTTTVSGDVIAHNAESLLLMVYVTSIGTGSVTPSLQGKEPISGAYFTFWTAELPITANGPFSYFFANGASGGEFTECQAFGLGPRVWRVTLTSNNANSVTSSVSCVMGDN